ncbi:Lanosterol synthase (Oxidosqualene--lanosterol cyclase) [Ascosphaera pollenicola]|nr:Lanosterol synthase (Oxidosqualene--lanosterol cyclase) [Ascosphaera pollenicola]
MRTFGLAEDIQGLLLLTSWLRKFEPEITGAVEERAGGKKQMRHAEDWDRYDPVLENRRMVRDQERVDMENQVREEIKSIVEDTPLLAPWPDDDEVNAYLTGQPVNE